MNSEQFRYQDRLTTQLRSPYKEQRGGQEVLAKAAQVNESPGLPLIFMNSPPLEVSDSRSVASDSV